MYPNSVSLSLEFKVHSHAYRIESSYHAVSPLPFAFHNISKNPIVKIANCSRAFTMVNMYNALVHTKKSNTIFLSSILNTSLQRLNSWILLL